MQQIPEEEMGKDKKKKAAEQAQAPVNEQPAENEEVKEEAAGAAVRAAGSRKGSLRRAADPAEGRTGSG